MIMQRRNFLIGFGSALAAPAVVSYGNIMPVRSIERLMHNAIAQFYYRDGHVENIPFTLQDGWNTVVMPVVRRPGVVGAIGITYGNYGLQKNIEPMSVSEFVAISAEIKLVND